MTDLDTSSDTRADRHERIDALEVLRRFAEPRNLLARIEALAEDSEALVRCAATSYVHALGFQKYVLSAKADGVLRLHLWRPGAAAGPARDHVHNHRAGLVSVVLLGTLTTELFTRATEGVLFTEYREELCEPRGDWRLERVRSATLTRQAMTSLQPGSGYALSADMLHRARTRPAQLTATLLFARTPVRSATEVFVPPGQLPPPRIRKAAPTPREYRDLLLDLRNLLGSSLG
jgi:hypothetical protein